MTIQKRLFAMQDLKYRDFHAGLCPTLDANTIIGVRTPILRGLAKEIHKAGEDAAFLENLPHPYYEENQIHAFLISEERDFDIALREVNRFLPYIDNWATCDALRPKVFIKNRARLIPQVEQWLSSPEPYTIRFGIEMLMVHFLDADFRPEYLERVSRVRSEEYYVNMMIAWFFATALAKQYEAALPYLTENRLDTWVHNKTIQKARESYRIAGSQKTFLNTLKRK